MDEQSDDKMKPAHPIASEDMAAVAKSARSAMPALGTAAPSLLIHASLLAHEGVERIFSPAGLLEIKSTGDAIAGVKNGGGIEELLAAQSVAFSSMAMSCLNRAASATSGEQREIESDLACKLAKTTAALLGVLAQWKLGASKSVAIGSVNLEPGAQAVLGNLALVPKPAVGQ